MALATAPLSAAFAELDVQVYEGDGAVGIIVSELNSGFDVALDENSKVIVTGNNVSDGVGVGGGEGSTNDTTTTTDNETSVADEELVIEIPHIGNITDNGGENGTSVQNNVTSSTEVINDVTGGNISEGYVVEQPTSVEEPIVADEQNVTTSERDCIGGILTEGYSEPTDFEICYI